MPLRMSVWPVAIQMRMFEGTGIIGAPAAPPKPRAAGADAAMLPRAAGPLHDDHRSGLRDRGRALVLDKNRRREPIVGGRRPGLRPPLVDQAGRNIEPPRHIRHHSARRERRRHDPNPLVLAPAATSLRSHQNRQMAHAVQLCAPIRTPYERSIMATESPTRRFSPEDYIQADPDFALWQQVWI